MKEKQCVSVSILGDSISTFEGWQPPSYACFYTAPNQQRNQLESVKDMWWARVIDALGGNLCANSSYSGSRVSGECFPAAHSAQRIRDLNGARSPEVILVYLGINDYGKRVQPSGRMPLRILRNPRRFEDAYDLMLRNIKKAYPKARIYCGQLLKTHVKTEPGWKFCEGFASAYPLEVYNRVIQNVCRKNRVSCINLPAYARLFGADTYETLDGAHPTAPGHQLIAACWISGLKEAWDA